MSLACNGNEDTDDEISNYLINMEKFRQDDLDAFDESLMEAKATMGSDCIESRKLRADARADREDKTKRFKTAVSHLLTDYQRCQSELAEVKHELQLARSAVLKDVVASAGNV